MEDMKTIFIDEREGLDWLIWKVKITAVQVQWVGSIM